LALKKKFRELLIQGFPKCRFYLNLSDFWPTHLTYPPNLTLSLENKSKRKNNKIFSKNTFLRVLFWIFSEENFQQKIFSSNSFYQFRDFFLKSFLSSDCTLWWLILLEWLNWNRKYWDLINYLPKISLSDFFLKRSSALSEILKKDWEALA